MSRRKTVTKFALTMSVLLIALWVLLGTNASLAWFTDEDKIVNTLNFGDLNIKLYHKTNTGYEEVDSTTKVFNDAALYEPGYTQLVLLKVENAGDVDFNYDLAVIPDLESIVVGKTEDGQDIILPEHLRFGLVIEDTEDALLEKIADRALSRTYATHELSNYSENGGVLPVGECDYCAMILYMPEEVANEANYRGDTVPSVEVGISAIAEQIR